MCRALLYLGPSTPLENLLFKPDNSLVNQVYRPKMLDSLNLAGFGMKAWDRESQSPSVPFSYTADSLPMFDPNLRNLAEKIRVNCLLAHVRGVPADTRSAVTRGNNHPFNFDGYRISLAHNGDLVRFAEMKAHLAAHVDPVILGHLAGTTDSEWIYALILSRLENPTGVIDLDELKEAIESVFALIRDVRGQCGIDTSSSANLFLSDGEQVIAVRYCFDFGRFPLDAPEAVEEFHLNYLSLWYTLGRKYGYYDGEWQAVGGSDTADTVIIASEPLTADISTWLEVPEYCMLASGTCHGQPKISLSYLEV